MVVSATAGLLVKFRFNSTKNLYSAYRQKVLEAAVSGSRGQSRLLVSGGRGRTAANGCIRQCRPALYSQLGWRVEFCAFSR